MKNKGVFIAMFLIIFLGAAVTAGTSQFVSDKTTGSSVFMAQGGPTEDGTSAGESLPLSAPPNSFEQENPSLGGQMLRRSAAGEQGSAADRQGRSAETDQEAPPQDTPAAVQQFEAAVTDEVQEPLMSGRAYSSVPQADSPGGSVSEDAAAEGISDEGASGPAAESEAMAPASPITAPSGSSIALVEVLTRAEYQKRLEEVDRLIENTKEASVTSNTDSYKNITDYEYRLWDTELNRIYLAVMNGMNAEESDNLKIEEREWIIQRDSEAGKAAARYQGGTMENLEYVASMAATTRARAYELLEKYADYLPE